MKTGIDITFVSRFEGKDEDKSFLSRVFTKKELRHINEIKNKEGRIERLAGKFCAKEAVCKMLGTGIGEGVRFLDIEILPDSKGKPVVKLYQEALGQAFVQEIEEIDISISHDGGIVVSVCVAN